MTRSSLKDGFYKVALDAYEFTYYDLPPCFEASPTVLYGEEVVKGIVAYRVPIKPRFYRLVRIIHEPYVPIGAEVPEPPRGLPLRAVPKDELERLTEEADIVVRMRYVR